MIIQDSINDLNMALAPLSVLELMGAENIQDAKDEIRAFCPIHGSDNQRSLAISKANHTGICHNTGCVANEGGNLIQLYAWAKDVKFDEAAKELANTINFALEYTTPKGASTAEKDVTDTFKYVEVAHGANGGFKRNQLIEVSKIAEWQNKHEGENCYRTYVRYDSGNLSELYPENAKQPPTVIGNFPMDFDNPFDPNWDLASAKTRLQNTVFKDIKSFEQGLKCCCYDAKEVIDKMMNDYHVPLDAILVSFSGRGIHEEVDCRVFGVEPCYETELMKKYKQLFFILAEVDADAEKVILEWDQKKNKPVKLAFKAKYQTIDAAMYSNRRLWRLANSINTKSGLFKVNIPTNQFLEKFNDIDWILNFAKEPTPILSFPKDIISSSKAVYLFENTEKIYQNQISKQKEAEKKAKEEAATIRLPSSAWRGIFAKWRDAYGASTEAADEFLFAGLLTIIGAMLGRRCYIWMAKEVYPNIYVVIVGDTARTRKTTAISYAEETQKGVDPNVIFSSGISTTQGLISMLQLPSAKELEDFDEAYKENPNLQLPKPLEMYLAQNNAGRLEYEGFRLLYYEREFSALLKKTLKDYSSDFIETLTQAYDMPPELDNHSMTNPISAPKPCVSVLGATTYGKLRRRLLAEEIEGGFANRFMYFVGERKPPKSLPPRPNQNLLNTITTILHDTTTKWNYTEFKLSDEAFKLWDDFYCREYSTEYDSVAIDEVIARLTTHTLKIALIYAATENNEPVINAEQMQAAIDVAEYLRKSALKIFAMRSGAKYAKIEEMILIFMQEQDGGITATEVWKAVRKEIYDVTTRDIQSVLNSLTEIGMILKTEESFKDSIGRSQKRTVYKRKFV
jgi:hypothetical protein